MYSSRPHTSDNAKLTDLVAPVLTEASSMFVPNVLSENDVAQVMELCTRADIHSLYETVEVENGCYDQLVLMKNGFTTYDDSHPKRGELDSIKTIGLGDRVLSSLAKVAEGTADTHLSKLAVFRMGPGQLILSHSHSFLTANILLQDAPRKPDTVDGLYFTDYFADGGRKLDDADEPAGHLKFRRTHNAEVGGMHARKAFVPHGVHKVYGTDDGGDRDPSQCRYVLTYVMMKLKGCE